MKLEKGANELMIGLRRQGPTSPYLPQAERNQGH